MSRLTELSREELVPLLDRLELALKEHPTKTGIVRFLASEGLCSQKSTGTEATLAKLALQHGHVMPLLGRIMVMEPTTRPKVSFGPTNTNCLVAINPRAVKSAQIGRTISVLPFGGTGSDTFSIDISYGRKLSSALTLIAFKE